MAREKIQLADNIKRVVFVETKATIGADIGVDLRYNGRVQSLAQLQALFGAGSSGGVTAHRLLQGLALGDDHPQYVRRDILEADGDLYTRAGGLIVRKPIGVTNDVLTTLSGSPEWRAPGALTKTDDTNVTLTLAGAPNVALLQAASITVGWSGTLGATRGGTSYGSYAAGDTLYANSTTTLAKLTIGSAGQLLRVSGGAPAWQSPAALTRTNDTNVTLTLGGTPASALLAAASLTLGWTGTLAETRGGTAQSAYTTGDLLYASASNTLSRRGIGTTGDVLTVSGLGVPVWAPAAGGASGANPTGTVGLTAVNGVATTYLRSDGAPPLSQSIAPVWTGKHIFRGDVDTGHVTSGLAIGNLGAGQYPGYIMAASGAPANARKWRAYADEAIGAYVFQTTNDAITAVNNALTFYRTGADLTRLEYGNPTNYPIHAIYMDDTAGRGLRLSAPVNPGINFSGDTAATDKKNLRIYSSSAGFTIDFVNDAYTDSRNILQATRNTGYGTTAITLGNADYPNMTTLATTLGINNTYSNIDVPFRVMRAGGTVNPGLELAVVNASDLRLLSYDRTANAVTPLTLQGSLVEVTVTAGNALIFDAVPTFGGAVAVGLTGISNKPGSSAGVSQWLPVKISRGGTTFYIPIWG